ncbi:MAG TPA: Holliday junction resolvase RuvX [Bacteroidales bacterium]|nr:Holliday junction resolvase RuvX [Bacteroidales bacterium]
MARILCIDYGLKRVGLAVTDPMQIIASPLTTVPTHTLLDFLASYFLKEKVESIVVGYPLQTDATDSEIVPQIKGFVKQFEKKFPDIPHHYADERFTSKMAQQALIMGGMKKKDRQIKGNTDMVSASLILQTYLEWRTNQR